MIDVSINGDASDFIGDMDFNSEIQKKIDSFRNRMSMFASLNDIESVIIHEEFTGWGECSYDTMNDFLDRILPEGIPSEWSTETLKALLSGKISDEDIERIDEFVSGGSGSPYGVVNTVITVADSSLHEEYSISV